MPISLRKVRKRLLVRLHLLDSVFLRIVEARSIEKRLDRSARQEGLVSSLWQSWCGFSRSVLLDSIKGAITNSGIVTTSPFINHSESQIAFVAKQLNQGTNISDIRSLPPYQEPTWGDLDCLGRIAAGIDCSNANTLLSAFSGAHKISDLQMCRNACAHLTSHNLTEIRAAKVRYLNTTSIHPSDLIFWIDPSTNYFLWRTWLDEIKTISNLAIQ